MDSCFLNRSIIDITGINNKIVLNLASLLTKWINDDIENIADVVTALSSPLGIRASAL